MDLKSLMIDQKSAWIDFPGLKGFSVEVVNLSRQELTKLKKSCTITKFDRKLRIPMESVDEEKFVTEFTSKVIKDWKGLTLEHLSSLILIDIGETDPKEELKYSQENAELLVQSSTEFDNWLNEVAFDLDNFR